MVAISSTHPVSQRRPPAPAGRGPEQDVQKPRLALGGHGLAALPPTRRVPLGAHDHSIRVDLQQLGRELAHGEVGAGHEARRGLAQELEEHGLVVAVLVAPREEFYVGCVFSVSVSQETAEAVRSWGDSDRPRGVRSGHRRAMPGHLGVPRRLSRRRGFLCGCTQRQ